MKASNIIVEGAELVNGMVTATVRSDGTVAFTPAEDAETAPPVVTTDEKFKITDNDTTPGVFSDKVVFTSGEVIGTLLNPGANEQLHIRLGTSAVIADGVHAVADQLVESITTSRGRITAVAFAAGGGGGGGFQGGYEWIFSDAATLSPTVGHTAVALADGGTQSVTLPAHTVDQKVKTICNDSTGQNAKIFLPFRFINDNSNATLGYIILPPRGSIMLEWKASYSRWIVKQFAGNSTTDVVFEWAND